MVKSCYNHAYPKIFAESRKKIGHNGFPPKLAFANGYVQSSVSREMIEFIVKELDLTIMINQLDNATFAVDEIYLQTLQATDALGYLLAYFFVGV